MAEKCSYCGEKGHSIQECPKWKSTDKEIPKERLFALLYQIGQSNGVLEVYLEDAMAKVSERPAEVIDANTSNIITFLEEVSDLTGEDIAEMTNMLKEVKHAYEEKRYKIAHETWFNFNKLLNRLVWKFAKIPPHG